MNTLPHRRGFIPLGLAGLSVLFFSWMWSATGHQTLPGSDFVQIHYPLLRFVVREVQSGTLPLWNPHQFLGYSVIGNPQYGLFYPPNWSLLLGGEADVPQILSLLAVLHCFWAAWGMARLAGSWGAGPLPALVGGAVFGIGGFMAARLYIGHYALLLSAAWLPWLLLGYRLAVARRQLIWTLPGGLALGLSILAGHPQMVYLGGLGLGILWLAALIEQPTGGQVWQTSRQLIGIVIVGGLLGAVAWLPAYAYSDQTARGQQTLPTFANQHAVPPAQLGGLIVPYLHGSPVEQAGYWGEPFFEEMTSYVGVLPLVVLMVPVLWRRRYAGLWLLTGVGLILSLGMDGGLYRLLYDLLPPARSFRAPGRALILTSVGLAGLLAVGLTQLQAASPATRRRMLRPALWGAPLLAGGLLWLARPATSDLAPVQAAYRSDQVGRTALLLLMVWGLLRLWQTSHLWLGRVAMGGLLALALFDVGSVAAPLVKSGPVKMSPAWTLATQHIPTPDEAPAAGRVMQLPAPPGIINGASITGHLSSQGYDPLVPARYQALAESAGTSLLEPASAVNRVLGVEYALAGRPIEDIGLITAQFMEPLVTDEGLYVYRNPNPLARAYLAYQVAVEPDQAVIRQRVLAGAVDQGQLVLLEEPPACRLDAIGSGTVTITRYDTNAVHIQVETTEPALLVLGDQYDPDWQVTIDDEIATLYVANAISRAVCVPAGEHTVRFQYQPRYLEVGAGLSGLGWLLVLVGGMWWGLRGRRQAG